MAVNPWAIRWPTGSRPAVTRYPLKAGETFLAGSLIKITSGEAEICGSDPARVDGIACDPAEDVVEAGYVNVYNSDLVTEWALSGSSNPAASNLQVAYGVTNTSGVWTLDLTDTTNTVFVVVDIDTTRNLFICKFIAAALI